jgi:hypothetical protein
MSVGEMLLIRPMTVYANKTALSKRKMAKIAQKTGFGTYTPDLRVDCCG